MIIVCHSLSMLEMHINWQAAHLKANFEKPCFVQRVQNAPTLSFDSSSYCTCVPLLLQVALHCLFCAATLEKHALLFAWHCQNDINLVPWCMIRAGFLWQSSDTMAHGCTSCTRINMIYSEIHLSMMHATALWLWLCCLEGCNGNDPDMYSIQPFRAIQPKRAWITWRRFLCDPAGWSVGSWNLDLVLMCLELSRFSAWGDTNNAWVSKAHQLMRCISFGASAFSLHSFRLQGCWLNSPSFVLPAPVYWQIGLLLQHMPQWDNSGALMRLDRFFADGRCLGMLVFLSDNRPNSHFDTRVRIGSGYSELFVDLRACFGTKLKRSQDSADSSSHPFFTFRLVKRWQISLGLCAPSLSNQNRSFVHKASLARLATQTSVCAQFAWECHPGEELNLVLKKMFKGKKAISASSRRQHKGGCRFLRLAWNCITAYCI